MSKLWHTTEIVYGLSCFYFWKIKLFSFVFNFILFLIPEFYSGHAKVSIQVIKKKTYNLVHSNSEMYYQFGLARLYDKNMKLCRQCL